LTTVGYGDIVPVTLAGKVLTSGLLVLGVAIIAVPGGLLASALTREE
jgi:voltage-gated potassium channel